MDNDEVDPKAVQKVQVVNDAEKRLIGDNLAAECDHEGLAAKGVDVGRSRTNPLDEGARGGGMHRR